MLYAPKASMPREVGGPLLRVPLAPAPADDAETALHKAIYAGSDFQSVMHCHVAEAEAAAYYVYPGETAPADRIIPVDAEGSFLYLVIPVLPPDVPAAALIRALHDYKAVVVRGGGVWSVGGQSLSEVLHHPSSLREICIYRIGRGRARSRPAQDGAEKGQALVTPAPRGAALTPSPPLR